ncbi:hypothetical protein SAZ_41495 [Streptomyces noursei ZPM]|nr:hypothetical protein SAZ_41495 [Streptomyces noursei ZPM]
MRCWSGVSRRCVARRSVASSRAVSVRPESSRRCQGRSAVGAGRAGASSRTAWALVPPVPKELTPARRGVSSVFQSVSSVQTWKGERTKSMSGLGRW